MKIKDLMTPNPACCTPQSSLIEVGKKMIDFDCGEIPVVENLQNKKPVGVITDRDIVCRTIGKGIDPMDLEAQEIMSTPVISVSPETDFEECQRLMEEKQIRRILVVDNSGSCCGVVSLADIAKYTSKEAIGGILQEVTIEIGAPSNIS